MAATVVHSQKDVKPDRLTFDAASKRRFDGQANDSKKERGT